MTTLEIELTGRILDFTGTSHTMIFRQYLSLSLILKETSHRRFISQMPSAPPTNSFFSQRMTRQGSGGGVPGKRTYWRVSDLFFHGGLILAFDNTRGQ